jgi:hypothetical protein
MQGAVRDPDGSVCIEPDPPTNDARRVLARHEPGESDERDGGEGGAN